MAAPIDAAWSAGQYPAAGTALAELPPDPDICVHLCPALGAGAVDALGAELAGMAGVLLDVEVADEEVVDDVCVAGVELVEALAIVSPYASVAPSIAAAAAVPMSGLVILTRFSFLTGRDPVTRRVPVGQAHLTGLCVILLSQR